MNANPNTTSYRMHELTRDRALQSADQERLAHEANGTTPAGFGDLLNRRSLRIAVALIIAVVLLTVAAQADAQALIDSGASEPYHPALVNFRVGIYYQNSGRHAEAVTEFSATIEAFPMIAEAWSARGDSYFALGEYELAIADYATAVEVAPNLVSALNMRGDAYRLIGEFELAAADYINAIGQLPEYPAPHAGLAAAFEAMSQHSDAVSEYSIYLELAGEDADPLIAAHAAELQQAAAVGAA